MPSAAMKYGDEQDQKTLKQLEAQLATAASPKARNALFAKIEEARARINRREELLNMPVPGA